jgi:hypothetical protein
MPGCTGSAVAVGVNAGLLLSRPSRVLFWLTSLALLATVRGGTSFLFPKRKRNEAKKTLSERGLLSVHSVQFQFLGTPKARCSQERQMCEPLLLANTDMNTLRHQCSRASTLAKEPVRFHEYLALRFFAGWMLDLRCFFGGYGLTHFYGIVSWWVGEVVRRAYICAGWLFADSARCTFGRFSHWWRSVWVWVFGGGGFHTSFALASTVLLGYQKHESCTLWTLRSPRSESVFFASFLCRFGQRNDAPPRAVANRAKKISQSRTREDLESSNPAMNPTANAEPPKPQPRPPHTSSP